MTDTPTPSRDDLAAISDDDLRELLAKATPGPWIADDISCSVSTTAVDLPFGRVHGFGCGNDFVCDLNDGEYHEYADEAEQAANAALIALAPQLAAEVLARRAPSAPVEVARLVERAHETLPGIETPAMMGDNLAVFLCGYLDNPHQEPDELTGWTPDGVAGYEQIIAAIRAHYDAAFTAASAAKDAESAAMALERDTFYRRAEKFERMAGAMREAAKSDHAKMLSAVDRANREQARAERAEAALAESEAKVKQHVEAETRAILARLDQPAEGQQ